MITYLAVLFSIALVVVLWTRFHTWLPSLAIAMIAIGPFLPIVSLLSHNVDGDRIPRLWRVVPLLCVVLLMALAITQTQGRPRTRGSFVWPFLIGYSALSLIQVPFAVAPTWALTAWLFSIPGYFVFLVAGAQSSLADIQRHKRMLLMSMVGFVAVQVLLITYGFRIGKASDLFDTRNFGSLWASNSLLAYLVLLAGLVWMGVRNSGRMSYVFMVAALLAMSLTLSRTALFVAAVLLVMILWQPKSGLKPLAVMGFLAVTLLLSFSALRTELNLDRQLVDNWSIRLHAGDIIGSFREASQERAEEFAVYRHDAMTSNPVVGVGMGMFSHYSRYTDAHNLFITEAYENGLMAAVLLFLTFRIPHALRALRSPPLRPVAISILAFLVVGQFTGGMLSYRAADTYYGVHPGWLLFFLVGLIMSNRREEAPQTQTSLVDGRGDSS